MALLSYLNVLMDKSWVKLTRLRLQLYNYYNNFFFIDISGANLVNMTKLLFRGSEGHLNGNRWSINPEVIKES